MFTLFVVLGSTVGIIVGANFLYEKYQQGVVKKAIDAVEEKFKKD